MEDRDIQNRLALYDEIVLKSKEIGFTMPSEIYFGALLKTLISSKLKAHVLELGTGIGLSLSWMIDALDANSKIISVDNDAELIKIVTDFFGADPRVQLVCQDGSLWLNNYQGPKFDLMFTHAWPGKYSDLDLALALLKENGFYVIDDMTPQENWPEGHHVFVDQLVSILEKRDDLELTKFNWSTGIIVATKKSK